MVLPHENIFLVLQPNLRFQNTQENIISDLNTLAWRCRRSAQQYHQVNQVLEEEEEEFGEILQRAPIGQNVVVIERIVVILRRNRKNLGHIQGQVNNN